MTARPRLDAAALQAALRTPGVQPLALLDRAERVRRIGECAAALLAGTLPSRSAALLVGGALDGWLRAGGSLERDFLRVTQNGSHQTPARLWQSLLSKEDSDPAQGLPSGHDHQPGKKL